MLRLTLVPQVHHLSTVDASVVFGPDATVADLALAMTNHYRDLGELPGGHTVAPVAPTGRWPPDLRLADAGLRSGAALAVIEVDESWFSAVDEGTRPMAIAHVAAGPSSGAEFPIHHDTARIGRDPSCEIRLNDPLVSRVHARVRLADPPEVQDEGSANGTQIDGVDVAGNTTLGWRQRLTVGDSEIWLEPLGRGAQATDGSTAGAVAVLRPPRLEATFVPRDLHIATPPERPTPQPPPWLTSALPLLMGAILWVVTKSLLAVVFTALSPMLFIGAWWESRRAAEREYQRKLERHRKHVGEQIGTLLIDQQLEREYLLSEFPDPSDLLRLVSSRAPRLWARQPRDLDFLDVRVGIGTKPSATTLTVEQGGEPDDLDKLNKQVEEHRTMSDVPILARLTESRSLAVVAPRTSEDGELRTVLLQLAIDHSPADVELVGILGPARAMHIEWLKWLPHATGEFTRYEHPFAVGAAEGRQLVERIIESATGEASSEGRRAHTLVVVDEDANLPRDVVERLLAVGREEPIFVIWTGARRETVPTSIALVLDSLSAPAPNLMPGQIATLPPVPGDGELGTLWSAQRTPPSEAIRPDRLGQPAAVASARSLAACVDVSAAVPQSQALPDAVRLPNLMADLTDPDDMDTVVQRWSQSRGLRGQVGMGVEGTFTLDLRADGPHGLVAGTTGSGKSELLQTLILSLAINNPPDRLTFLLVDYKGGAAFKECGELPHTVGYITDLTTRLVNRALTSLGAEITKREHALDRYGAKNLIDLEASHPQACPPSLLIVVDEFAALAAEVPDFVNGMVNIAQRGRSLGMHMILATQRPQGVITENIRANTDLRIALRVAADADSQDVIGVSDAAHVSRRTPGRAWIRRIGQGEATPVQSAFVGARKPPGAIDPPVELRDFTVRASQARVAALLAPDDPVMTAPTDLERLVVTVGRAADETGISSGPPPWVKELGSMVTFRPLRRSVLEITDQTGTGKNVLPPMTTSTGDAAVPIGLADEPLLQRQSPISLDYRSKGSYLVLGTSGSGKTELLRSIALSLSIPSADPPPHIYVIELRRARVGLPRSSSQRRHHRLRRRPSPAVQAAALVATDHRRPRGGAGVPRCWRHRRPATQDRRAPAAHPRPVRRVRELPRRHGAVRPDGAPLRRHAGRADPNGTPHRGPLHLLGGAANGHRVGAAHRPSRPGRHAADHPRGVQLLRARGRGHRSRRSRRPVLRRTRTGPGHDHRRPGRDRTAGTDRRAGPIASRDRTAPPGQLDARPGGARRGRRPPASPRGGRGGLRPARPGRGEPGHRLLLHRWAFALRQVERSGRHRRQRRQVGHAAEPAASGIPRRGDRPPGPVVGGARHTAERRSSTRVADRRLGKPGLRAGLDHGVHRRSAGLGGRQFEP